MGRAILSMLFCCLSLALHAQLQVTGIILNATDKKPVPDASVFLDNTTVGNKTEANGKFLLQNVKPGQYDLVVSVVGYEVHHQTILVNTSPLQLPPIELTIKTTALKEVNIKPDPEWEHNFDNFKRDFLGTSDFAAQCKILNPEVVDLSYDKNSRELTASSYSFMEIENKALGYKIHYQLTRFIDDYRSGSLYYEGLVSFEELSGKPKDIKRWLKNRQQAYLGSNMHFLRAVLGQRLNDQGFEVRQLIRKPNPQRPPDSLIRRKMHLFIEDNTANVKSKNDSLNYWRDKNALPREVQYLVKEPLEVTSLVRRTDQKGIWALAYPDYLYVIYKKSHNYNDAGIYHPADVPNKPVSIMKIMQYAFFDSNGTIVNPSSTLFEGAWGIARVAQMLPVDYQPATGVK